MSRDRSSQSCEFYNFVEKLILINALIKKDQGHSSSWTRSRRFHPLKNDRVLTSYATWNWSYKRFSRFVGAVIETTVLAWELSNMSSNYLLWWCFFFTSWYIFGFSLGFSIYCANVCQTCSKQGELFSLRWFSFSPRACVCGMKNRVFLKSRSIALLNLIFALLALSRCFISCWKKNFSLCFPGYLWPKIVFIIISFYVEVTNALKVVYREVLRHTL